MVCLSALSRFVSMGGCRHSYAGLGGLGSLHCVDVCILADGLAIHGV